MSNWLFLMLLYAFFGWMKKKQRDKARDQIESQDDWESGGIVGFGEGILDALIGDDNNKSKDDALSYDQDIISTQDGELIQNIEDEQVDVPVQTPINTPIKKVESEVTFSPSQTLKKRKHKSRNNKLAGLINLEDPIKTGIVFKEIFDKPKSLRRYKK